VHTTQLTTTEGKEMQIIDIFVMVMLMFAGGFITIAFGALTIWLGDLAYQRRIRNGKQSQQKTTDHGGAG
jgi:hypothetical protein